MDPKKTTLLFLAFLSIPCNGQTEDYVPLKERKFLQLEILLVTFILFMITLRCVRSFNSCTINDH